MSNMEENKILENEFKAADLEAGKPETAEQKESENVSQSIEDTLPEDGDNAEDNLQSELEQKTNELKEMNDKYLRLAAEYDNFRKRSIKERELVYVDAFAAAAAAIIPSIDNLERALSSAEEGPLKEGVDMTLKQLLENLGKIGVTEIDTSDKKFNPELHNAIMHIEDDAYGENEIVEVFQKGYIVGDRVIRYSQVKVAN